MPESANEHLQQLKPLIAKVNPTRVLDVGMGRGNYGWFLRNECQFKGHLTGLEVWAPYVEGPEALVGGNRDYYDVIHVGDVRFSLPWVDVVKPDLVFLFDVLEHMTKDEAILVLRGLQRASTRGVLVSTPIVSWPQGPLHGNPFETHLAEWTVEEVSALGCEIVHLGDATGLFHFPGGDLDVRVSVTLNTVRSDDSYRGRPIIKSILEDLRRQTFTDFELVIADGLHADRCRDLIAHDYPFRILHVPPRQTPMVKDRRCAIAAYKNTVLSHTRGELVITLDDGCVLQPTFIQTLVDEWDQRGNMLNFLYMMTHDDGSPIIVAGDSAKDSRHHYLGVDGRCVGPVDGNWMVPPMQGFSTIPMKAALEVNGYDEMYDGARGFEDYDMGWRLQKAGYRIALDVKHRINLLQQGHWSTKIFGDNICAKGYDDTAIHCNQQTIRLRQEEIAAGQYRANEVPWGDDKWSKVAPRCYLLGDQKQCTLNGHPCPYIGHCSDVEHPSLRLLRETPPVFNLRNLRYDNGIRQQPEEINREHPPEQPSEQPPEQLLEQPEQPLEQPHEPEPPEQPPADPRPPFVPRSRKSRYGG